MKVIPLAILSILTISSTLSAATYVTTSGSIQNILKTSGEIHPYSGVNLSAFAYLPNAELNNADLTGADLPGADLTGADLTGADLTDASLAGSLLAGADLTGADLNAADLTGANLIGADFYSTWLNSANLSYANLTSVSNVHTAIWLNSNLYGATLPYGYDQAWFESEGATFVPEPSSYALLLGGLALGLIALRRR